MVGHPGLSVKKWSKGQIIKDQNGHITSTVFGIGGNSGSPVLDDEGNLIAIHHSGRSKATQMTANGLKRFSFHSPTKSLIAVLEESLTQPDYKKRFFSLASLEDRKLAVGEHTAVLNSFEVSSYEALGPKVIELCEQQINDKDVTSNLEMRQHWGVCLDLISKIHCPDADTRQRSNIEVFRSFACFKDDLRGRVDAISTALTKKWQEMPGSRPYWGVFDAAAHAQVGTQQRCKTGLPALEKYLKSTSQNLDLYSAHIASSCFQHGGDTFLGKNTEDFLREYQNIDGYEYDFHSLIIAKHFITYNKRNAERKAGVSYSESPAKAELLESYERFKKSHDLTLIELLAIDRFSYFWRP